MILHFFYNDKFIKPFINFMNRNFNQSDHIFIIWGGVSSNKIPIPEQSNVIEIKQLRKSIRQLLNLIKNSETIIIHSFYNLNLIMLLNLLKRARNKAIWIAWGGDIYPFLNNNKNLKLKIIDFMRKRIVMNLKAIATLVSGDYDLITNHYKVFPKYFKAIYMSDERTDIINKINLEQKIKKNNVTKIIIGNSATPTNNHEEILIKLYKFRDYSIEIYCPLSYGDSEYGEKIKNLGNELFGEKFYSINRLMPMKEYTEFLSDMDIGIFNNDRQQGLGNIFSLLYLGKKVYLKNNTTMWKEIYNEMKLVVSDINKLETETFDQFIYNENADIVNNMNILNRRYDPKHSVELWEEIFR